MNQILTSSRLKAFRSCARLHQYRYLDCKVPFTDSLPMRFGTLFHAGLESWWMAYQLVGDERILAALQALGEHWQVERGVDEEDFVVAMELLRGYHVRWHEEPLVTELVEHEFDMPLVNPATGRSSRTFTLHGKIDAKVFDTRDQRRYLVEHKTTTSDIGEGSGYWQRLRMDGQVSVYYDAFPDVAGCVYDVIRRPGQRRLKATPMETRKYTAKGALYANQRAEDESLEDYQLRIREAIAANPDDYYKRGLVVRLDNEIREHQADVWHQANLMRELANEGMHPRNPDACFHFNRMCDYFDVCTGVSSIDDPRLFQIRAPHPELANADQSPPSRMDRP